MNRLSIRIPLAALAILAPLTLGLVACDALDRQNAPPEGAVRLDDGEVVRPMARYAEGEVVLVTGEDEARESLMEIGRDLIPDVEAVRFEAPTIEWAGGVPFLTLRGKNPEDNCALIYAELGTVREGSVQRAAPLGSDGVAPLYLVPPGGTCTGAPCNSCSWDWDGEIFFCECVGTGPGGEPGFCNHSTRVAD